MFDICIIGCGDMGTQHASAWRRREDCRVVAVHDVDAARRETLAQACGARAYADVKEAIGHPGVQIVSVCTPVCFHAEVSCTAMRLGKHVLCEKPIALTLAQADEMIETARAHRVQLAVSLQYRSTSRQVKLAELVRSGAFGVPILMRLLDVREVR